MARSLRLVASWLFAVALPIACSHDWDALDPRLGSGGATGSGASAGGGSGGVAGSGNAGGSGATSSGGTTGGGGVVAGGGGGGTSAAGGTGGAGGGGTGGGADAGPTTKTYTASIAECIALLSPNPPACEATAGPGLMTIDNATPINDGGTNFQTAGYLRFNLDSAFAGQTVLSVTLRLTVGNESNSGSGQSGEINAVTCFQLADLSNGAPAKQGGVLSPNQGSVNQNEVVNFLLPVGSVTAGQPACLGIYSLSTDGVDYGNTKGANPPELIIQYQ